MKQTRYILLIVAMVLSMYVSAQITYDMPTVGFRSTSCMACSGTMLPQAAVYGTAVAGGSPMSNGTSDTTPCGGPRRVGDGSDWWDDPASAPIGALPVVWLLLLAGGYAWMIYRRRAKA